MKHWGKIRITNELKQRKITQGLILKALKEITNDEYLHTFHTLSEKYWETITEKHLLKKRKNFCDYLFRRGFESHLVYDKLKMLENEAN
jgi:regulatory protein